MIKTSVSQPNMGMTNPVKTEEDLDSFSTESGFDPHAIELAQVKVELTEDGAVVNHGIISSQPGFRGRTISVLDLKPSTSFLDRLVPSSCGGHSLCSETVTGPPNTTENPQPFPGRFPDQADAEWI
jgi:hypothetical protein